MIHQENFYVWGNKMHLGTMKKIYCVSIQSQMCMSIKSQISLKKCRKEEGKKGLNSKCFEHEIDHCLFLWNISVDLKPVILCMA